VTSVKIPNLVSFCDLVRDAGKYSGKTVEVRATYRYGFEWQELYCISCLDKGKAWLELPSDPDEASRKAWKRLPKGAGIVNLTVTGVFMSGGHFGHLNGYPHEFIADSVKNVAVVGKGMPRGAQEEGAEKRWACGGSNPK
jgi:hypothetical protein